MSRIGRLPVQIPSGVDVTIAGQTVTVKGPKGTLSHTVAEPITVERDDSGAVVVKRPDDERRSKAYHGLSRSLLNNLVVGTIHLQLAVLGALHGDRLGDAVRQGALGTLHRHGAAVDRHVDAGRDGDRQLADAGHASLLLSLA